MTDVAYDKYADHLINHLRDKHGVPNSPKLWSLLVCNGYNSHVMLSDVLEKFWKAAIYVTSFPSHTSSELQPLYITCFRPVKSHSRRDIHTARLEKGLLAINKWLMPEII